MNKTSRYTYTDFAQDVLGLLEGKVQLTDAVKAKMADKAKALLAAQESKAAYNAAHPKKGAAKGASAETKAKADAIRGVLTSTPMTAAEINAALGEDYTALQVANAVKFIEGVQSCKVVRAVLTSKGLRAEKEYTAYSIG